MNYPHEITDLRIRIGEEYLAMSNSQDSSFIREKAQAIELLAQELMEACDMLEEI